MLLPNRRILLVDDHPLHHEGLAGAPTHAGGGLVLVGSEAVEDGLARASAVAFEVTAALDGQSA